MTREQSTQRATALHLDIEAIQEGIAEPLAFCDANGRILTANLRAWNLMRDELGVVERSSLAFNLTVRSTASHFHIEIHQDDSVGFYLADVQLIQVDDAWSFESESFDPGLARHRRLGCLDLTITPLPSGGLWVRLSPRSTPERQKEAPADLARRALRQLAAFARGAEVLSTPEELVAYLASTLQGLVGDVAIVVELGNIPGFTPNTPALVHGYALRPAVHVVDRSLPRTDAFEVPPNELLLHGSVQGCRFRLDTNGPELGILQIESQSREPLDAVARETLTLGAQHLANAIARLAWSRSRASESLLDEIDALVCVCDARRRILATNRAFVLRLGEAAAPSPTALTGRDLLELVHPDDQEELRKLASLTMGSDGGRSVTMRLRDVETSFVAHLSRLGSPGGVTGFSLVLHDRSETGETVPEHQALRRTLEARLEEAERLISLGQLAAGIAHEIKNPLTSILSYSDYLLGKYRGRLFEARDSERLERIIQGVERIDRFVRNLLHYARPGNDEREPAHLNGLLDESVQLCEVPLGQIQVNLQLDAQHDQILAVPGQIQQIFINLLTNAAAAVTQHDGAITVRTMTRGSHVVAEVEDNGCGIPTDRLPHIFEPFFTSRADDDGTGLGLSIVRNLVERHNGVIEVQSTVGSGTCVAVTFPLIPSRN